MNSYKWAEPIFQVLPISALYRSFSLIQQCRSSGFSDRAWCEQNDFSKIVSCHGNAYVNFCVISV